MTGYFKGTKPPAGKVPLPSVLGGPGGIKAPAKPAAKPAVHPPVKPPATRVVTVKQHTRRIPVKQPDAQNTVKAEPATPHGTSKRFYHPLQKGQKPSGYEPVGRRPGRAGIGSHVTSRPYWLAAKQPDQNTGSGALGGLLHAIGHAADEAGHIAAAAYRKEAGPSKPGNLNVPGPGIGKQLSIVTGLPSGVFTHPIRYVQHQQRLSPQGKADSAIGAHVLGAMWGAPVASRVTSNAARRGEAVAFSGGGKKAGEKVAKAAPEFRTAHVKPYVNAKYADTGVGSVPDLAHEKGYLYHRTDAAGFKKIAREGLAAAQPQGDKPAGVYFAQHPLQARGLSWKSNKGSVYVRVKKGAVPIVDFKGDARLSGQEVLSPKSVPPQHLEYLGEDGAWHSLVGKQTPDAAAQLREGLKGSRSQYGREKAARKIEEAARAEHAAEALRTISDPDAALAASGAALRGKYATIDYKGLKELNPETVKTLMSVVQNHPTLGFHDKRTVMRALRAAVDEGRNPRPAELRKIEMVFGKKTAAGLVRQAKQTLGDRILNVLNIPRALQTTGDISGLFRQNLVGGVSHPIIWGRTFPKAFTSMTEHGFEAEQQAIKDHPLYYQALQDGLRFTDIGDHAEMVAHPEGFQSDIAANALDRVPKVPNIIKGSARSYVATGNHMRMAIYENRMRIALAAGDKSIQKPEVRKQIADVINAATGFGTLPGRADHLLPAMNTFLYSPRLLLSRLHYLDPSWYFRLKGPARREAMRGLFALAGSVTAALYTFSHIPGVEVDWQHPQSPDWGKLKIGNMRVDIAGGFQQYVRLAAELAPAALGGDRTYSTNTGQYTKLGSGYGKPTRLDVGLNFIENKLSPIPGAVVNAARGKDAAGNKVTPQGMAANYLTPLGFQDAYSSFKDKGGASAKGIEWAAGAYGLSALGLGVQDYKPKPSKAKGKAPSYFGGSSSGEGSPYFKSSSSTSGGSGYFGTP